MKMATIEKAGSRTPSIRSTPRLPRKENERPDLFLSGSQINLLCRPRIGSGKASVKSMSVSSARNKRPVSAMPVLGHQSHRSKQTSKQQWRRPQSADNPCTAGVDDSSTCYSSLLTPESSGRQSDHQNVSSDVTPELVLSIRGLENDLDSISESVWKRKSKIAARFPLLDLESDPYTAKESVERVSQYQDVCSCEPEANKGFGSTYVISQADVQSVKGRNKDCAFGDTYVFDGQDAQSCASENSDHCISEKSLGERIRQMARRNASSEKPPLPCSKPAREPKGSVSGIKSPSEETAALKIQRWFRNTKELQGATDRKAKNDEKLVGTTPYLVGTGLLANESDITPVQSNRSGSLEKSSVSPLRRLTEHMRENVDEVNDTKLKTREGIEKTTCQDDGNASPGRTCDKFPASETNKYKTDLYSDVESWMELHLDSFDSPRNSTPKKPLDSRKPKSFVQDINLEYLDQEMCHVEYLTRKDKFVLTQDLPEKDNPCIGEVDCRGNYPSTYDEIVETLKLLEEEEANSVKTLDELKQSALELEFSFGDSAVRPFIPSGDANESTSNASPSSAKLKDLLSFLDEVDKSFNSPVSPSRASLSPLQEKVASGDLHAIPRLEELLNMGTVDLAHEVLTLRLQLEEKANSVKMLQDALNQQREVNVRNTKNADKDMKQRLKTQKEEYESTIQRHQKFIDQLIADKKTLSEKCEALVVEVKTLDKRHQDSLKVVEGRQAVELQRMKEMQTAAEKIKRERWIDEKTKKIKEMTVKGLEPELQRMMTRHQQELNDIRALHKQELEDMELMAARRVAQQMEQLREQLLAEREEALARERELSRQRLEKQTEEEERAYQEQRRRLLSDIRKERDKLAEEERRMKEELEELKKSMAKEYEKEVERVKMDFQENLEAAVRKNKNETKELTERLEAEKEAWMNGCRKKLRQELQEKEQDLREQQKRERDREIEMVIDRLEAEATQARQEHEKASENRLRRLKEKYESELKDVEASEEAVKAKYNEVKRKLLEKEDEVINLKATVRQLEKELQEVRKISDRLSEERANVKNVVRNEFVGQISKLEDESQKSRQEMCELKARHKVELQQKEEEITNIRKEKDKELDEVHRRIKLTLLKKDETVNHLKAQHESALQRCCHLEALLEQQRRDFLLK